ncbi:MAG: hypothetical protein ABI306_06240 [Caulobacteraceae bacterium]
MSYTKTLLVGVALCAFCTAPALARQAPPIHLASMDSAMHAHVKTNVAHHNFTSFTETITFTGTLSQAANHEVPVLLWGETWQDTATCLPPSREDLDINPRKTGVGTIRIGTSTGPTSACPSSTFTFYGPMYELEAVKATSDHFSGPLTARHYSGYNLTLNTNTDLTITP